MDQDIENQTNCWAMYDQLIDNIPSGIAVIDFSVGLHWSYIEAECGMGISHTVTGGAQRQFQGNPCDLDLRALAGLIKSWNFVDASLGLAAVNAWYAQPDKVRELGGDIDAGVVESHDASNPLRIREEHERYAGKKITVVGHFPMVERLADIADVTVLERNCRSTIDTPDSACEYIIPEQDFVFMTGTAITNKTAPRLLELAHNAETSIVGPSAIPSTVLFDYGADEIAGSVVVDPAIAKLAVRGGNKQQWRASIKKFSLRRR